MPTNPDDEAFKGLDTDFGFQSPFDSEDNVFPDDNEFNHAFDDDFGDKKESKGSSEKKRRPRKSTSGRSVSPSAKEEVRSSGIQRGVNRNRSGKLKSLQKTVGNHSQRVQDGSVGSGSTDRNDRSFRSKNRHHHDDRRHSRPANDELGYGDPDEEIKTNKSRSRRHLHDDTGENNSGRRSRRCTNEDMATGNDEHAGRRSRHPANEDHNDAHGRRSRGPSNEDEPPPGRRSRRPTNENMGYGGDHHREKSPTHNASDENVSSRAAARIRASQFGSAAAAFKAPEPKEADPREDQPDHAAPAPTRTIRQRPRRRASLVNQVEPKVPERGVRATRSGDLRPRMRRGLSGKGVSVPQDQAAAEGVSDFPGVAVVSDFPGVFAGAGRDLGHAAADADALPPAELDEWAESRAKKQREMMERFKQKKDQEAAEKAAKEAAEREAAEKAEMEELDLGYDEVEVKEAPPEPAGRPRRRASIAGAFGRKKSFATLDEQEDQAKSKRALKKEEKKKEKEDKKKAKEEKKAAKKLGEIATAQSVSGQSFSAQPAPARVFAADRERRRPGSLLERIGNEEGRASSARGFKSEDSAEPSYSDKMLQMLQK